jgi:hypothetical protein
VDRPRRARSAQLAQEAQIARKFVRGGLTEFPDKSGQFEGARHAAAAAWSRSRSCVS